MALPNAPFGLRPARHFHGGTMRYSRYPIASAYGTALYTGDPVALSSGTVVIGTAGTTNVLLGVFMGCFFTDSAIGPRFSPRWPAAQADSPMFNPGQSAYALVSDDPSIVYEVMMDTSTSANEVVIGKTFNLTSGTGSNTSGLSGWLLNSTAGTAVGGQCKAVGVLQSPGNQGTLGTPVGAFGIAEVILNTTFWAQPLAGV